MNKVYKFLHYDFDPMYALTGVAWGSINLLLGCNFAKSKSLGMHCKITIVGLSGNGLSKIWKRPRM